MIRDAQFSEGDAAIRRGIAEAAARRGIDCQSIELTDELVYRLRGSARSVAFRAKDIRSAADPEVFARRIAPRLEAMFEELWWRQAVILMTGVRAESLRRS